MAGPQAAAAPHGDGDDCPRCGAALRFEDEDGTRECVCGWSERPAAPPEDGGPAGGGIDSADGDDPMLV